MHDDVPLNCEMFFAGETAATSCSVLLHDGCGEPTSQ